MMTDRLTSISDESLPIQTNNEDSILTSTQNPEIEPSKNTNNPRRNAIIPTPNRPNNIQSTEVVKKYNEEELVNSNQQQQNHNHPDNGDDQTTNQIEINKTNSSKESTENISNEDNFDSFILQHFVPFSGLQNVNNWLDETEEKFNEFKVPRNLRYEAISLLIEGDAKRIYIKHRRDIKSFDDFYEFLILQYTDITLPPHTQSRDQYKEIVQDTFYQNNSQKQPAFVPQNGSGDFGATKFSGEIPAEKSPTFISDNSTNFLDQTTNDLRKAIVGDLIKNPKVFKGAKDDVQKWIETIEHLLDIAQIPESSRLKLISYSLRGDALEWYKNNKDSFTNWNVFIQELKRAFVSSFHAELAFKKLELYTQGENQSIRNFFNEVLKLCKEADSTMSEATKLKNLLNKTKSSIQFEVRKKKPTSTAEFLEYAKDIEELFQLSNIKIDNGKNNTSIVSNEQISYARTTIPTSNNNYSTNSSTSRSTFGYSRNSNNQNNNYNNNFQNGSNRYNFRTPTSEASSFRLPQSVQTQSRNTTPRFPTNRNNSSVRPNNTTQFQPSSNQSYSSNNNQHRQRTANTILSPDQSDNVNLESEPLIVAPCTICNQPGHEASSCKNFQ